MQYTKVINVTAKTKEAGEMSAYIVVHNIVSIIQFKSHTTILTTGGVAYDVVETAESILKLTKDIGELVIVGARR